MVLCCAAVTAALIAAVAALMMFTEFWTAATSLAVNVVPAPERAAVTPLAAVLAPAAIAARLALTWVVNVTTAVALAPLAICWRPESVHMLDS